jgi:hypothetical protein
LDTRWDIWFHCLCWSLTSSHSPQFSNGDCQFATPIWRRSVDKRVVAHRDEHRSYLENNGFFGDT